MVTYCIVAATFVGSPYVLMTRGHVNVDILPLHLDPTARYWLALFTSLLALAFIVVHFRPLRGVLVRGLFRGLAIEYGVARATWIPYLSMPIGLGLLILQYVADMLCLVTGRAPPFGIQDKQDAEDHRPRPGRGSAWRRAMSPTTQGSIVLVVTLLMLVSGIPVALGSAQSRSPSW